MDPKNVSKHASKNDPKQGPRPLNKDPKAIIEQNLRSSIDVTFEVTASDTPLFDPNTPQATFLPLHLDPIKTPLPDRDDDIPPRAFPQPEQEKRVITITTKQGDQWKSETVPWDSRLPKRSFNFRLTKWGSFSFAESYTGFVAISCQAPIKDFTILKYSAMDLESESTNDMILEFTFTDPLRYFDPQIIWENTNLSRSVVPGGRRDRFLHERTHLGRLKVNPEWQYDPRSDEGKYLYAGAFCRSVRLVIKDYNKITKPHIFSPSVFKRLVDEAQLSESDSSSQVFCQLQSKAIHAESTVTSQKLAQLKREKGRLRARIVNLPGFLDRFALRFGTQLLDAFQVPEMSRIFIKADTGFFFDQSPGPVPMQKREDPLVWQGVTFLKDRLVHCSIDNILTQGQTSVFRAQAALSDEDYDLHQDFAVSFDEEGDEALTTRLMRANKTLLHVMCHQMNANMVVPTLIEQRGRDPSEAGRPAKLNYQQSMPGLMLHKLKDESINRPIPYNQQTLNQALNDPIMQLAEASHQMAIKKVFDGVQSRTVIEGPPATGKTTVLAKLIMLLSTTRITNLDGAIIAAAHTNEAVRVLCARTLTILSTKFDKPEEQVCLVISDTMLNYWKMAGKKLDSRLENAMLSEHLNRQATAHGRHNYKDFIEEQRQIRAHGRSYQSQKERAEASKQRNALMFHVKKNVRVWFATLSTLHLRHSVFGMVRKPDGDTEPNIKCHVLVIDEASQATDIYVAMSVLTTDPRNIVFAGDAKQLAPYHASTEAEIAWALSLFEKLKPRSTFERLKMQYRSKPNLYAGTNVHYDNEVYSHGSTVDRPRGREILNAMKRISFKDAKGKTGALTNNIHIIDLKGTVCEKHATGTHTNTFEWLAMRRVILALRSAGIRLDEMLILTPYQGQYDLMRTDELQIKGTTIKKIDSAQGDESEVTIFGIVRTAQTGGGFTFNVRRHNVTVSRHREAGLYFLDMGLVNHPAAQASWRKWIDGLLRDPANRDLILTMQHPVQWFIDGKPMANNPADVIQLAQMNAGPAILRPSSRPASPVAESRDVSTVVQPKSRPTSGSFAPSSQQGRSRNTSLTSTGAPPTSSGQHHRVPSTTSAQVSTTPAGHQRSTSTTSIRGPPTPSGQQAQQRVGSGSGSAHGQQIQSPNVASPAHTRKISGGMVSSPVTQQIASSTPAPTGGSTVTPTQRQSQAQTPRARLDQMNQQAADCNIIIKGKDELVKAYLASNPGNGNAAQKFKEYCVNEHKKQKEIKMLDKQTNAIATFGGDIAFAIATIAYNIVRRDAVQAEAKKFKDAHGL